MGMLEFSDIDSGYDVSGCQPVEQEQSSGKLEQSNQYQTDVGPESKSESPHHPSIITDEQQEHHDDRCKYSLQDICPEHHLNRIDTYQG